MFSWDRNHGKGTLQQNSKRADTGGFYHDNPIKMDNFTQKRMNPKKMDSYAAD